MTKEHEKIHNVKWLREINVQIIHVMGKKRTVKTLLGNTKRASYLV